MGLETAEVEGKGLSVRASGIRVVSTISADIRTPRGLDGCVGAKLCVCEGCFEWLPLIGESDFVDPLGVAGWDEIPGRFWVPLELALEDVEGGLSSPTAAKPRERALEWVKFEPGCEDSTVGCVFLVLLHPKFVV